MDKLNFIVNEEEDKKEIYRPVKYQKIHYAPNERRFLVDILNLFKLCFYLQGHKQFIIPDLLDTKEPKEASGSIRNAKNSIRFVYEYEYLPKSIMPHIMVEAHLTLVEKWRTGCVLQNNGCKALLTNYQNRISILVTGEYKKKREFMAVIRHLIDSINQELSDKPRMLIPLDDDNAFADYEVLLTREKRGKEDYIFDEDKPTEKKYRISELLEGIPSQDEVRKTGEKKSAEIFQEKVLKGLAKLSIGQIEIIASQEEIKEKLDSHYEYLINLPHNGEIKKGIIAAIKEMNAKQSATISKEIMQGITDLIEQSNDELDDRLNEIYEDLKKTDDVQIKLKLAVPFINLLGINLETEFDIKNWTKKMYEKHKLKIYKLMGVV